jgi:hypothetical protein
MPRTMSPKTSEEDLKMEHISKRDQEVSNLARRVFVFLSIATGLSIMGLAFLIARDENVRDPSIRDWQGAIRLEILVAVGTSIVASTVFYLLYSKSAEEKVLREVGEMALEHAMTLFASRFERMLPTRIFSDTDVPTEEFNTYFNQLLKGSKSYKYKGDAASFTTFRLSNYYASDHHYEREITLLLLDPREEKCFEERAQVELMRSKRPYNQLELMQRKEDLRNGVYVSLVALFDLRHRVNAEVAFYKELPFFRSEIMDEGILISYYLGGQFPSTYSYGRSTLAYEAFLLNFRQNYEAACIRIAFNTQLKEDELKRCIQELGCSSSLEDLRLLKEERFKRYRKMIKYG